MKAVVLHLYTSAGEYTGTTADIVDLNINLAEVNAKYAGH